MRQRTALVTGASSGIGKAIAAALAARGYDVIGTCRAPRKLAVGDRIPGVRYLALDLGREASVKTLLKEVTDVDVFVNNAGVCPTGPAEEVPTDKVRETLEIDFVSAVRLTQAFLPGMRSRGMGALIFVGSMKAEAPSHFSSMYSAAKAALKAFAGCLRMEVKAYGVKVAVIAPMYIRTALYQEIQMTPRSPYAEALRRVKSNRDAMIGRGSDPKVVADVVLKILGSRSPRAFYTAGRLSRAQAFLARHLPRGIVEANMARRFGI